MICLEIIFKFKQNNQFRIVLTEKYYLYMESDVTIKVY